MKLRCSRRTFFIGFTILALVVAFVATHPRLALGALVMVYLLISPARGMINEFVEAWPELKKPKVAKRTESDVNR